VASLQRTLILTYTLTFARSLRRTKPPTGSRVHTRINGIDPVTGLRYDALDPELLLYVHACLVDSALLFEELTVGRLDDAGRQRFHEEQMLAAELLLVPHEIIPQPSPSSVRGSRGSKTGGVLQVTEGARRVAELFLDPPEERSGDRS